MAKCIKCGGSFFGRGKIKLKDAEICFKCFDDLGFDHKVDVYGSRDLKWDEIKNGRHAYWRNKKRAQEEWIKDHPEVTSFMEAIDEGHEEDDSPIEE